MQRASGFGFGAYGPLLGQQTCAKGTLTSSGLPWLILDLCEELDEPVVLPAFMDGIKRQYGRQVRSSSSSIGQVVPLQTPTVTQTLPWGVIPTPFPSTSFDGSRYIVFATDTSISTFFSTTTLPPGAAAYTSVVTAQNLPAVTNIIGVTQKSTNTVASGAKAGIGVGVALVVILLAMGFAWFIIVHRRKTRRVASAEMEREKNNGGAPEHISTLDELANNLKSPGSNYKSPGGIMSQELSGIQMHTGPNELPASSSMAIQRYELQESSAASQRAELGPGDRSQVQDSSERDLQSHIQRKAVSPGFVPFPPPWATSPHQGNDGRPEQYGEGQSEEETRNIVADEIIVEPDEHDPELRRLEQEMAKVQVEKERLQRLQDLETREEDLKKIIEQRRRGPGGQSSA